MSEEKLYKELTDLVDAKEWVEAKELTVRMVKQDHPLLAKKMMDYYNEYICNKCLGTGEINVNLDDRYYEYSSTKCECQL